MNFNPANVPVTEPGGRCRPHLAPVSSASGTSLDWPLIRMLADYSAKAYRHSTVRDNRTEAHALVTLVNDGVVVAFRGSKSPEDFIQDAKFEREWIWCGSDMRNDAEVHQGFLEDFESLTVELLRQVQNCLATSRKVKVIVRPNLYITGHSLGGALAILCAIEFSKINLPIAAVVTFGQPRVGDKGFSDLYNTAPTIHPGQCLGDITYHVINADDPVPLLPPLLAGYRDEGNEIYLPPGGPSSGFALNPPIGLQVVDDVLGAFASWRRRKLAFVPNHFIQSYLDRIA